MAFDSDNQKGAGPGGRRVGAGRKPKKSLALAHRVFGAVSEADWGQIVAQAVEEAKEGGKEGAAARVWLADRCWGRVQQQDVAEELQRVREEFEAIKATLKEALAECPAEQRAAVLSKLSQGE